MIKIVIAFLFLAQGCTTLEKDAESLGEIFAKANTLLSINIDDQYDRKHIENEMGRAFPNGMSKDELLKKVKKLSVIEGCVYEIVDNYIGVELPISYDQGRLIFFEFDPESDTLESIQVTSYGFGTVGDYKTNKN